MKPIIQSLLAVLLLIFATIACVRQGSTPSVEENPAIVTVVVSPSPTPIPTATATPLPTPTPVPAVRIEAGDQALFNGDWERALIEYQTLLEISNTPELRAAALLGMGRARLMARNYYEVNNILEGLIAQYPDSPEAAEAYFALGQAYYAQERYYEAAEAYLAYLTHRPGVIDAYVLDLRGDALFAAADYAGAANDYQAALGSPSLLDEIFLQLKLARSYALAGDAAKALTLYTDLENRTSSETTLALIALRTGQAYEALGQTDEAIQSYLKAVQNYPTAYDSYNALLALVEAGVEVDQLQRGIVDYHAGEYGVALAALDRYLQENPIDPLRAYYYYGLTTRALGDYTQAIQWWDKVIASDSAHPVWDDAWEEKAYTQWAFLEQYEEATQTLLDFTDKAAGHPRAAEFLFDAALIAERANNLQQAAELYKKVNYLYPNYERAAQSLFLAGITYYRLADFQNALVSFQHYLTLVTALEDRAAANLWVGKVQQAMGDLESARASWETAAGIDPTGYYSERARDLLYGRQPFTPPQDYDLMFDLQAEHQRAQEWVRTTFAIPAEKDLSRLGELANDARLQRGLELWRLGLYDLARTEFEQMRLYVATDAGDSFRLANFMVELGNYRTAILAARQVLDLALMDDASTLSAPTYFNHVRFGNYFNDQIIALANQYGFHPLFLFSLVRQESLFDPHISSSASAQGLMQIMPATGADIARNLGWPENYSSDDLLRPEVNLNLGVEYLDTQRKNFDGNFYAALAAYNGGPGNAEYWYATAPDDLDLFLEVVRFVETRNYIRGIYEIFNIYRLIYDRTS